MAAGTTGARVRARRRARKRPWSWGDLDFWLDRAYARLGWRLLLAYVVFGWLCGGVMELFAILGLARVQQLSTTQLLELAGLILASFVVGLAAGLVGSRRRIGALRTLGDPDPLPNPEEMWRAAFRAPVEVSRWNCLVAALWSAPTAALSLAAVGPVDRAAMGYIAVFVVPGVLLAGSAGVFGAQLVMRPILRDLARRTGSRPAPFATASVRLKLVVLVPAITVTMAGWAALFATTPGARHGELLSGLVISMIATALVALPVTGLMAFSLLKPLDDLVQAADRLRAGRFGVPVPELSADEYGILARSFNEAMGGLAERQALADHNERLLVDVRESRARIIAASDAERRRVERNLHDGAQQRLVALIMDLRMLAEATNSVTPAELRAMAEDAGDSLDAALDELRELARGLHPPVLETEGLIAALKQLTSRSAVPVLLSGDVGRLPVAVESTAYFVVSEALANAAKHSRASGVRVAVSSDNEKLGVEIADDGVGGARLDGGSGLRGLADRVAALDGRLTVRSTPGAGTTVTADIPIAGD